MGRLLFKSFFFCFLFVTCCCDYLCRVGMVLGIPGISGLACSPLRASSVYEGEGISLFRAGQAWMRTRDGRFFLGSRPWAGCLHRAFFISRLLLLRFPPKTISGPSAE